MTIKSIYVSKKCTDYRLPEKYTTDYVNHVNNRVWNSREIKNHFSEDDQKERSLSLR